jgi:small GTP-binding protein
MSRSKVLIVGDGAIGKTCLISQWTNQTIDWNDSEPEYEPTTFNNFILEWDHPTEGQIQVEMWDTAGQEAFEQLRKLSYPGTDIYLVGYACNERSSLNNIQHKWLLELKEVDPDPWFILVGTKCDLRAADSGKAVPQEDAEKVAKECDACAFVDTSAKTREGMDKLKQATMYLAVHKSKGGAKPKYDDQAWNPEGAKKITETVKEQNTIDAAKPEEQAQLQKQLEQDKPAPKPAAKPAAGGAPPPQKQQKEDNESGSCIVA